MKKYTHYLLSGLVCHAIGIFSYVLSLQLITVFLSPSLLAQFFVVNAVAVMVGQIATAGIDAKLYYINSAPGMPLASNTLRNAFVYIPISLSAALAIYAFPYVIFPFYLSINAFFFIASTLLVQPTVSNVIAIATARQKFNIANVLSSLIWTLRATLLLLLIWPFKAYTHPPEFLASIYNSFAIASLLAVSVICFVYKSNVVRLLSAVHSLGHTVSYHRLSRFIFSNNPIYFLSTVFSLLPLPLSPYLLMRTGADSVSVAAIGILLSIFSLSNAFIGVFYTRSCIPHFFDLIHSGQISKVPFKIFYSGMPLYVILLVMLLASSPLEHYYLTTIHNAPFQLAVEYFPFLFALVVISTFLVPSQILLAGGETFQIWALTKIVTSLIAIITLYYMSLLFGLTGALAAIVIYFLLQSIGFLAAYAR